MNLLFFQCVYSPTRVWHVEKCKTDEPTNGVVPPPGVRRNTNTSVSWLVCFIAKKKNGILNGKIQCAFSLFHPYTRPPYIHTATRRLH